MKKYLSVYNQNSINNKGNYVFIEVTSNIFRDLVQFFGDTFLTTFKFLP